ncbi:MAG: hypothetical protein LKE46_16070 [Clostridium sp.]|jgi:hypothetical protein|uniref:hypothetical protein n=1 Tax=Clostridium sp. TaxID=1506 RepID=UPI0025BE2DF4|nr:hypothetical protein [Clostridium sp.]MCH3965732.1 hypothetical protein [Clostridium sp.]
MIDKTSQDSPWWFRKVKTGVITNYIKLIVYSYNEIKNHKFSKTPIEDTRRNLLVESMSKNKSMFGIIFNISTENGTYDKETYKDTGRIDICCYISELQDKYIAFECKRFIKNNMTASHFKDQYLNEGMKRFFDNIYSENMDIGGMIAFAETGDFTKLDRLLSLNLNNIALDGSFKDISSKYEHNKVFETKHKRINGNIITLSHIIMDFT